MPTDELRPHFGEWLRQKRRAAGLSLQELGERAGFKKSYLSIIEIGKPHGPGGTRPRPMIETVDRLADGLGVSRLEARLAAGYNINLRSVPYWLALYNDDVLDDNDRAQIDAMVDAYYKTKRRQRESVS